MANLKITELPVLATIQDDSPFAVVDILGTPITSQVTITGMTFQGGSTVYNTLSGIADPATPILFSGDGVEFLFTGDTFNTKRFQSNVITSVMVTYRTSGGAASDISYMRMDVDATSGTQIYLTNTNDNWNTISFTGRESNLSNGSHTIDLYMNLASGADYEFAQVTLSAYER